MVEDNKKLRENILKDADKKGKTSKDKGVFVTPDKRAPRRPEYLHMSKKDFQEAEKKRKENDAKARAYRQQLETDIDKKVEVEEAAPETSKVKEAAKRGRQKKD